MQTTTSTARRASSTIIPQWVVNALGGPEETLRLAREINADLRAAGYSAAQRAKMGTYFLLDMAEARQDAAAEFDLARGLLRDGVG